MSLNGGIERQPGYAERYLSEARELLAAIDAAAVDRMAYALAAVNHAGGRLFCCGLGGSAAHASHAAADFRKTCGFEAYCPTDNVAELTAWANDHSFEQALTHWLEGSRLGRSDALLVFSTSGTSPALLHAVARALRLRARVFAIVGVPESPLAAAVRKEHTLVLPLRYPTRMTAHTEGLMAVLWHCLVSHPALKAREFAWEGRQQ